MTLERNLALVDSLPEYPSRRSRDDGFGRKGGTSATAGRTAETISATINGTTYRKRVFFGQRFITVSCRVGNKPIVTGWHSAEKAGRMVDDAKLSGCDFAAWAPASPI